MTEKFKHSEISEDDIEDDFYRKAEQLPEELAETWIRDYEELEDPENSGFFERFNNFLEQRKQAIGFDLEFAPETPKNIVEEIAYLQKSLDSEYGNPKSFLGEGRTAKVHIHPKSPNVCIKYIKDVNSYTKTDIPLYQEYARLRELQNFNFSGVRTPTPYFEDANGGHIYGMERIIGNTFVQIMEKPEENQDLIRLARTLDREVALDNIVNYVQEMHNRFKITHNDLEVINIMLGNDGNLYIIDFGKSKLEEIGEDHELYRDNDIKTVKSAVKEFFIKIDNLDIG